MLFDVVKEYVMHSNKCPGDKYPKEVTLTSALELSVQRYFLGRLFPHGHESIHFLVFLQNIVQPSLLKTVFRVLYKKMSRVELLPVT